MEVVLSGASGTSSLYLWDLRRGTVLKQYRQAPATKKGCVSTLADHFLMVASDVRVNEAGKAKTTQNSKTLAWSLENEPVHSHSFVPYNISALVGSACGNYAFAGTQDGLLLTWHAPSGTLLLAVGCSDGLIHILRVPFLLSNMTEVIVATLPLHALPITSLSFSTSCSSRLYSTALDQTFKVWHTETKTCLCTISFPTSLNSLSTEDVAFVGGVDGNIYKVNLWDLPEKDFGILDAKKSGQLPQICTGHKGAITGIDLNLDGSLLVSGSDDETIKVWSTATCQQVSSFSRPGGPITFIKVLLKPIPMMLGTSINAKDRKTKENITIKLADTNSNKTKSLTHLRFDATPIASNNFIADQQLHEFSQAEIQSKIIAAEGGSFATDDMCTQNDKLKQEIEKLKKVNAQWKALNNEMLASTLKNFEL